MVKKIEINAFPKSDKSDKHVMYLADVDWFVIGNTRKYDAVKKWIAHICRDVTNASCIDEICIADILSGLRTHGFEVVSIFKDGRCENEVDCMYPKCNCKD